MRELAVLVSQTLERAGITATLSGGGAVSMYSDNEYQSHDLDFVSSERLKTIGDAITPLGFRRVGKVRQFEHPDTQWYVEFPPGPLAFGETVIASDEAPVLETEYGLLRIITPTHCVMDRIAAYVYWQDNQSLNQAAMVASRQNVDWLALYEWAKRDGIDTAIIDKLKATVT
jgi:hypothetical protein